MKILIFGTKGYLGSNCLKYFSKFDEIIADDTTNIANFTQVQKRLKRNNPDWVLNCVAKTDEDEAEENLEYWKEMINSNLLGAINVLKVCYMHNINLCYIRTPFEIEKLDDYSLSKISASEFINAKKYENIVLSITPGWFFSGKNSKQFDSLLIRSIKENIPLGITNNSLCTPVYMPDFVKELEKFIVMNKKGDFKISATESCTRYEFAKCLADNLGKKMEDLNWKEDNNFKESAKRPKDWRCVGYLPSYKTRMKDFIKENF